MLRLNLIVYSQTLRHDTKESLINFVDRCLQDAK